MEHTDARLYVDVGQTGSRVLDTRGTRHAIDVGLGPGMTLEALLDSLLSRVTHRQASVVMLALTGLRGKVPDLSEMAAVCAKHTGCESLGVCDDGLAWSVGSLDDGDGVALAVGGGVVAVSRSRDHFFHGDGNGSDFGDSGSAYWLGRKGIRAGIRAAEGSGPVTVLADVLTETYGAHDEFVRFTVAGADVHRVCIDFAPKVLDRAEAGDPIAEEICRQGASRLGALTVAAASHVDLPDQGTPVALGGGLMNNDFYRGLVEEVINSAGRHFEVMRPLGDAIDGLLHLGRGSKKDIGSLMTWWKA